MISKDREVPRVLLVTPEVTYLRRDMGESGGYPDAEYREHADVVGALAASLFRLGLDVHLAVPDYRRLYNRRSPGGAIRGLSTTVTGIPDERIHLAEDRAFFYLTNVYSPLPDQNLKTAIAFQREVINNIIPRVQPDIIHCHDWMTGLIPAMARRINLPCLFTVQSFDTAHCTLEEIEDRGIDAAQFWNYLFFEHFPHGYAATRSFNRVDFLASGILAAQVVTTGSSGFLREVVERRHHFVASHIRRELRNKVRAGRARGILNAPDPAFNPLTDRHLRANYGPPNHGPGKKKNKRDLQTRLGLMRKDSAPVLFWPSRLDPIRTGCQLLAEILAQVGSRYEGIDLQVVVVADGPCQACLREIVRIHNLHRRVAVCNYQEELSHLAYGASDFVLLPSTFEPCALPGMLGLIYGCLPIAYKTGGIQDTVQHLQIDRNIGNGFLFEIHDCNGLLWAISRAVEFFGQPAELKDRIVERVMTESIRQYSCAEMAGRYFRLYAEMLQHPLPDTRPQETWWDTVSGALAGVSYSRRNSTELAVLAR